MFCAVKKETFVRLSLALKLLFELLKLQIQNLVFSCLVCSLIILFINLVNAQQSHLRDFE